MNAPKEQITKIPKFKSDDEEAKWWAESEGPGVSQAAIHQLEPRKNSKDRL